MNNGRAMHELREFVDRKSDVRTCKRGILKTTNNLAIFNRISQWGVVEQCEIMCWWERCLASLAFNMLVWEKSLVMYFYWERNKPSSDGIISTPRKKDKEPWSLMENRVASWETNLLMKPKSLPVRIRSLTYTSR